ncbi:hypothetical protein [Nocardia brevicatena]|uniref:hypothetical protein n=1 Tax=Nocardia brevicatena TaxID=37327 RepID=UPI0003100089|nr:hypothetical protein [Nocardia brevicatena]
MDTTIRVVDGDRPAGAPRVVVLPCEQAMSVWPAHRCEPALTLVQETLARCADLPARRFWSLVDESVSGVAAYVPDLARTDAVAGMRRGQGLLPALEDRGLPVRRIQWLSS